MSQLYILVEHAAGYTLFRVTEFEEVSVLTKEVQASLRDFAKFRSLVHLVAFKPFKTSRDALENMNSISEGILHQELQLFLETNLPKKKKQKQAVVLGVGDPKLAFAITEALGFQCQHGEVVPEITRGIRQYFLKLVTGFTEETANKAQLALALNYSRAKVKFNINRADNMVIHSIAILDQLDKDLNTFVMRIREWYSYHFPELAKVVTDNSTYAQAVSIIKDRNNMVEDVIARLEEVLQDSSKVDMIMEVARTSMGIDISPIDLINIENFCTRVTSLVHYRENLVQYLKDKMHNIAPNLASLIGASVGARLISRAGSLTNLAKYPASTVQILGAEKALFRALKVKGNTPKYGLIFHSTFISRAAKQNKGRISRYLSNKCSLASRIDCFSEVQSDVYGKVFKQQVEDRLKFFDCGDLPPKNVDVMTAASKEAAAIHDKMLHKKRKLEKKKKNQEMESFLGNSGFETSFANSDINNTKSDFETSVVEMQNADMDVPVENGVSPKKKKKKHADVTDVEVPSKKKRKHSEANEIEAEDEVGYTSDPPVSKPKKKKKSKHNVTVA